MLLFKASVLFVVTFAVVSFASVADAQVGARVFDESLIGTTWTKVQDGRTVQWSVIPPDVNPQTRIDLVVYTDDGEQKALYLIRWACSDVSNVGWQRVLPGHILGVGVDCNGDIPATSSFQSLMGRVDELPVEAVALIP